MLTRVLLWCTILVIAAENQVWVILGDFGLASVLLAIGVTLRCLVRTAAKSRPDPNPPGALASAFFVGLMARGIIDLLQTVLT